MLHGYILDEGSSEGNNMSVTQVQVNYQTRELYIVAIILKHRNYFLIILLLYIFWVVEYYEGCCLELYEINEE